MITSDMGLGGLVRSDGVLGSAETLQPPSTVPVPPKSKTRTPVIVPADIPRPELDPERERPYFPRPFLPPLFPDNDPYISEGTRWFPDGSREDFVRRTDPRTGDSEEIVVARYPNPTTRLPIIREPVRTPQREPVKTPVPVKIPVPTVVPNPEPQRVPFFPDPLVPSIVPRLDPQTEPSTLVPVPRTTVPPVIERPPREEPERRISLTIPLPPVPDNPCDPCIQALEEQIQQLQPEVCELETSEIINILEVTITTEPTILRSTFSPNQVDIVYLAGYFCFTVDGYDIAPEIPVRRLNTAAFYPRGANGFRLYPTNGAVLTGNTRGVIVPYLTTKPPDCLPEES